MSSPLFVAGVVAVAVPLSCACGIALDRALLRWAPRSWYSEGRLPWERR